jgi:hypothetical protein
VRLTSSAIAAALVALAAPCWALAVDRPSHSYRCPARGSPPAFAHYWLGPSFENLPLTDRRFRCGGAYKDGSAVVRTNTSEVLYGDCDPSDGGCALPLEIQTSPACDRSFADYDFLPGLFPRPPIGRLRGVPSARFEGGTRLELYTGDVTVVVFADAPGRAARAAAALASTPESPLRLASGSPLPAAVEGHLRGSLVCGLRRPGLRVVWTTRRAVTIRARVRAPGFLWGELRHAGENHDRPGIAPGNVDFAFRVKRGVVNRRIRLDGPGRYVGRVRLTALDGRHSRDRLVRFSAPQNPVRSRRAPSGSLLRSGAPG